MKISVVIPAFNASTTIGRQLEALAKQTYTGSWEVVVANNGSSDATASLVQKAIANFPKPLRLVDASRKQGAAHARNVGVVESKGEFIAFCDADDQVEPDWLSALVAALEMDFDVVGGFLGEYKDRVQITEPETIYRETQEFKAPVHLGGNSAVRRSSFIELGGYDESFQTYGCEDFEIMIRARKAKLRIGYVPAARIKFTPTTRMTSVFKKIYYSGKAEVRVWARHPEQYPKRIHLRSVLLENLNWVTSPLKRPRSTNLRNFARSGVTSAGHLAGVISGMRKGWGNQQLLDRSE